LTDVNQFEPQETLEVFQLLGNNNYILVSASILANSRTYNTTKPTKSETNSRHKPNQWV